MHAYRPVQPRRSTGGTAHLPRITITAALGFVALLFLVPLPAAASASCPDSEPLRPRPLHPFPKGMAHDAPFDTAEGCPTWRWVALQRDISTPCPEPDPAEGGVSWRVRPLFAELADGSDVAAAYTDLPAALRSFCVYRTDSTDPALRKELNDHLERLLQRGQLIEAQSGCAAVAPMATSTATSDPYLPILEDQFRVLAGSLRVQAQTLGNVQPQVVGPKVRMTFIDTEPTVRPAHGFATSHHGLALMDLARQLVCRDDAAVCSVDIRPELGLPIATFDTTNFDLKTLDYERGGRFGTIDQLAQAVWRALNSWLAEAPGQPLVLNLSVGWIGEHYGGLEPNVSRMPISVQAFYRTLQLASCHSALIVAAAGNNVGGPEIESGPLLPGAWERRAAPGPKACAAIRSKSATSRKLASSDRAVPKNSEPLVYAVGGIHADGVPLVNARPNSEPPRVAFADHAVSRSVRAQNLPAILTGSSVATTVVASAAAAIWSAFPGLLRAEVMTLIDESGTSLNRPADVFLDDLQDGPPPTVHKVSVCRAVNHARQKACDPADGDCPQLDCDLPTLGAPVAASMGDGCVTLDISNFVEEEAQGFCERQTLLKPPGAKPSPNPCPFRQFEGICAKPWGCPQPGGNPCINCPIDPPPGPPETFAAREPGLIKHNLLVQIDPEWKTPIQSMTLGIGDKRFSLPFDLETTANCYLVTGIDSKYFGYEGDHLPTTALYFQTDEGSVESPIYVAR